MTTDHFVEMTTAHFVKMTTIVKSLALTLWK